jgi:hypothetical protein
VFAHQIGYPGAGFMLLEYADNLPFAVSIAFHVEKGLPVNGTGNL